jgi:hypothetical protein
VILNTMEGTDEGFEGAYFDASIKRGHGREHGAIVDLPVEGPTLDPRTPVSERRAIGPRTSDVLASMAGMDVDSAPFTILVHASQPAAAVQQAALRLANAIVADPESQRSISVTPMSVTTRVESRRDCRIGVPRIARDQRGLSDVSRLRRWSASVDHRPGWNRRGGPRSPPGNAPLHRECPVSSAHVAAVASTRWLARRLHGSSSHCTLLVNQRPGAKATSV